MQYARARGTGGRNRKAAAAAGRVRGVEVCAVMGWLRGTWALGARADGITRAGRMGRGAGFKIRLSMSHPSSPFPLPALILPPLAALLRLPRWSGPTLPAVRLLRPGWPRWWPATSCCQPRCAPPRPTRAFAATCASTPPRAPAASSWTPRPTRKLPPLRAGAGPDGRGRAERAADPGLGRSRWLHAADRPGQADPDRAAAAREPPGRAPVGICKPPMCCWTGKRPRAPACCLRTTSPAAPRAVAVPRLVPGPPPRRDADRQAAGHAGQRLQPHRGAQPGRAQRRLCTATS